MAMVRLFTFIAIVLSVPASVQADATQVEKRLERIAAAWQAWSVKHGVTQSQLAVGFRDEVVLSNSMGIAQTARMPLASVSKSVTGVCTLALVKAGALSLTDSLADLRKRHGAALRKRVGAAVFVNRGTDGVTVEQLLTHTSGLSPDHTQVLMPQWLDAADNGNARVTRRVLTLQKVPVTPGR
ncbi:MAG: serine hydrolase domain-containing protein, partial [Pseudomonadota bacterium]